MQRKERISILILGTGTSPRWLYEIERANQQNDDFEITGTVLHPYDCMLFIPEDTTRGKLYERSNLPSTLEVREANQQKNMIPQFDAVIPRIAGERVFEYGCNVIRQLALSDVYTTAPAHSLETCSNKWKTTQLLSLFGLPVPDQILLNRPDNYKDTIDLIGGLPAVGKLSRGSQGNGVFILETVQAAITALQSMEKLQAEITLNRFVKTGKDSFKDIRVWVIGCWEKEPKIFAMQRETKTDFRTNLSLDGVGTKIDLTDKEKEICIKAAQIFNMDVCAVDLIRDIDKDNKPFILELNGNPGTKIEKVISENVVGAVVDHVVETVKKKRRGKATKSLNFDFEQQNLIHNKRLETLNEAKAKLNRAAKTLRIIEQQRAIMPNQFSKKFPDTLRTASLLEDAMQDIWEVERMDTKAF